MRKQRDVSEPLTMSVLLVLVLCAATQASQASFDLPLDGLYHPGRFMPLVINVAAPVRVEGTGVLPCNVDAAGSRVTLPILVMSRPAQALEVDGRRLALSPVSPEEKIVCDARVSDAPLPDSLRLGRESHLVKLAPDLLLAGPIEAWTGIDLLIVDAALLNRLDGRWQTLAAWGVSIAVVGGQMPDTTFPWQRVGSDWILQSRLAGPSEAVDPDLIASAGLTPVGQPPSTRRQVMLAGVLIGAVLIASSLWRSRWGVLLCVGASFSATAAIALWSGRLDTVRTTAQTILIQHAPNYVQEDEWEFEQSPRKASLTRSINWLPALRSPDDARRLNLTVTTDAYRYDLSPNASIAWLRRTIHPRMPTRALAAAKPEERWLAGQYATPPLQLQGVIADDRAEGDRDIRRGTIVVR